MSFCAPILRPQNVTKSQISTIFASDFSKAITPKLRIAEKCLKLIEKIIAGCEN